MYISRLRIESYKSFVNSGDIHFSKGFNVIVGPNNAGKTALIEALAGIAQDNPHKSYETKSERNQALSKESKFYRIIHMDRKEFDHWALPFEDLKFNVLAVSPGSAQRVFNKQYNNNHIPPLNITSEAKSSKGSFDLSGEGRFDLSPTTCTLKRGENGAWASSQKSFSGDSFDTILIKKLQDEIIHFSNAQRYSAGESGTSSSTVLESSASNLPSVLKEQLSNNQHYFNQFKESVQQIFPEIKDISFPSGNTTKVFLWPVNQATGRDDLAIPLTETGTGIGQVMAMLYVVVTSDIPRIIIIDEPQSFLHPDAIRKLFETFKRYPQHQYIVTTHSPLVISAADPDTIIRLRKEGFESKVEVIDKNTKQDMERVLRGVGASLSDVFGADNILWVEGPTEEKCFSMIVRELCEHPLLGTVIVGVLHTGDFEGKDKSKVDIIQRIYGKLSEGAALIPPAIRFIFDRETRTPKEIADLKRMGISFLKYRMYENYLLHPEAIAYVLTHSPHLDQTFEAEQVKQCFREKLQKTTNGEQEWNEKYFEELPSTHDLDDEETLKLIHGADVLKDIFLSLTNTHLEYDKVVHGLELTKWLIEKAPEQLNDIKILLDECLSKRENTSTK